MGDKTSFPRPSHKCVCTNTNGTIIKCPDYQGVLLLVRCPDFRGLNVCTLIQWDHGQAGGGVGQAHVN